MQPLPPLKRVRRSKGFLPFKFHSSTLLLRWLMMGTAAALVLGIIVFIWLTHDLPSPGQIRRSSGFSTVFVDRNDKVLFEMFEDKNRIPVRIEDVPDDLKHAVIAIEDKNFYEHSGFSIWGYVRSLLKIATTGKLAGGSTLTQQLVKNVLLTRERTIGRKAKELVLSVEIERRFTKDEILEMYLNESPFGGTFWGAESAAKGYFDKNVKDLNLVESAIIAGLPQRPSVYSPIMGTPGAYKGRTKDVLRRMREDGYITREKEKKALADLESVVFKKNALPIEAPQFVFYVRDLVAERFGTKVLDEGITVKTTLDLKIQKSAQEIAYSEIQKIKSLHATNTGIVALDSKNAHILAMVGSYDYTDKDFGQYNVALARRQPGSAVKPFTYATALQQGYTAGSLVMDVPTEFPNQGGKSYNPVNYDGKFRGPVQYRFTLANSLNVPAVKVLARVGIRNMMQTAFDMGVRDFEPTPERIKQVGLSITLGGGETTLLDLTNAFSTFAREGQALEPQAILEIRDHKGKVLYKAKEEKPKRVLPEGIAFIISHILSDNNARFDAFGTSSFLNIPGRTVAVKTGTTNDKKDNWALGYTNDVTVGVWVGNNDNTPMNPKIASGLTGASPIWNSVMRKLFNDGYKDGIMDKPDDVEALQIDALLGGLPIDGFPTRSEYFIKGTEPTDTSPMYKTLKLSKSDSSRLANDVEIKSGDYEEKKFIVITEEDPISTDGKNRWQEAINAWAVGQSDERYKAPTETSQAKSDEIIINFKEPDDEKRVDSNDVRVRAKITSLRTVKKAQLLVNEVIVREWQEDKREVNETLNLPDGVYTVRIKVETDGGNQRDNRVRIGVNRDWDESEEPTEIPSPSLIPTL
ncbi:hypothetical protein A3F32_02700 [Candidatus Roizmanbacteria bacterium RIFCSPHIGHO2_12_FULL_42_10]|uniref:Uncharacterized protein n=2 Tax=Candidatus Roizmaniibacteriota TaxID=1752723 RepID=A0A1F7I558_9BACT|nr:MAG: hypothetical protein A3D08_03485 [Candidatus Roizmanbacteria bacterium RIFCSPHIGHO2_02_FULL_43_11]OGK38494.1 MAG: hypothetical protein A3F32_02700 [Candidatus Roizmanbacteria bacterium RIFCSPHIGHO2_12_FULL_42_10]